MRYSRDLDSLCVRPDTTMEQVIAAIERGSRQIALVVDEARHLLGTITDGDVRRAILRKVPGETPAAEFMQRTFSTGHAGMTGAELLEFMRSRQVRHVPLLDQDSVLVDLVWIADLLVGSPLDVSAVVMAGGYGTRLHPLTADVPKPLLPVGGRPLLDFIVEQLRGAGIRQVCVATHYRGDQIADHFGDGEAFGVQMRYLAEESPQGTAGALARIPASDQPVLVINGDILTRVDFGAMLAFHQEHDAVMTVAVKDFSVSVPYGVLDTEEARVVRFSEKPTLHFFINAGVYLLGREAHEAIPTDRRFDMTELIQLLLARGRTVASFPVREYWLDVGRLEDYRRAQDDVRDGNV